MKNLKRFLAVVALAIASVGGSEAFAQCSYPMFWCNGVYTECTYAPEYYNGNTQCVKKSFTSPGACAYGSCPSQAMRCYNAGLYSSGC
jgi:hypothetical protein